MSPLTLRRRYLPRRGESPRAHQAATQQATPAQAKPLTPHLRPKETTTTYSNANRNPTLTKFKPGFEQTTERELAIAFKRPVRTYKEDPPFYPWLPPAPLVVNFNLNYKG
nr:MAG: hypothetical protein [Gammatorquevirus sp.]